MYIAPANLLTLWTNAQPMNGAKLAFAPKELRERWNKSHEVSAMSVFKESAESSKADGLLGMELFAKAFTAAKPITDEREQIMDTCEKQLMLHIKTGALRGFAFGAPRTHGASPIELSPRVWNGQLDWYQSKITHESLSFVEVRLITARKAQTLLDSKAAVKTSPICHTSDFALVASTVLPRWIGHAKAVHACTVYVLVIYELYWLRG